MVSRVLHPLGPGEGFDTTLLGRQATCTGASSGTTITDKCATGFGEERLNRISMNLLVGRSRIKNTRPRGADVHKWV